MGRNIIKRIECIYLKIFSVKRNDLTISGKIIEGMKAPEGTFSSVSDLTENGFRAAVIR